MNRNRACTLTLTLTLTTVNFMVLLLIKGEVCSCFNFWFKTVLLLSDNIKPNQHQMVKLQVFRLQIKASSSCVVGQSEASRER